MKITGYQIVRSDCSSSRSKGRGRDRGGVAVYLRDDIAPLTETILTFSNGAVEVLGVHIKPRNILLFVVYRQPDDSNGDRSTSSEFKEALDKIENSLKSIQAPYPEVVLCGDFNLPHMDWKNSAQRPGGTKAEKCMMQQLEELMSEFFLFQLIEKPTHRLGNTLDLIFSNNPEFIHQYSCNPTTYSDHHVIEGAAVFRNAKTEQSSFRQPNEEDGIGSVFDKLNFFSENVDWEKLEEDLANVSWRDKFLDKTPPEMMAELMETCADISQKHVPHRKTARKKHSNIPRNRRILMRRRCKVNKQLCSVTNEHRKEKLLTESRDIEKKLQESYRNERNAMEHKAVNAIKRNSKYFFSYAKKFSTIRSCVGPFIDSAKNVIANPIKMAEMLASQYSSVFSQPKKKLGVKTEYFPDEDQARSTEPGIQDICFSRKDIEEAINEVSPSAAAGPDRFPAILLKICRKTLSEPLFYIWRKSLDTGTIPHLLKSANIIPIHKGNTRSLPKNYRPIALTSHLIKVFEKVIRKHVVNYMEEHNLFNPEQHGFRIGRSCLSQLLNHYDHILYLLEQGHNVDVIYVDFAKAFDKVDFDVTLKKINQLGIRGKVGQWIYSFITNRTQTVLVNGCRSDPSPVRSGVPQGSVLGPLLFLILIGDIDQNVASAFVSSFADDTRVGHGVNTAEDAHLLQKDLDQVYQWTEENNMELNGDKFEHLRYTCTPGDEPLPGYTSNKGTIIEPTDHVKDLGVTMSCDGSFKKHILNMITAAKKQSGWILRTFVCRDSLPMMTLWKSLVQCKLDYCSQLWSPFSKGDIQAIEMIQRSFLRKIRGVGHLHYWDQLKTLHMYSQERRRERYATIYVWRILEGQVPNITHRGYVDGAIASQNHSRRGRLCTIPPIKTQSSRHIQLLREASLPVKGQRLFNCLPMDLRNMTGCKTDVFKHALDRYLRKVPDEPQIQGYTSCRRAETNSLLDMCRFEAHQEARVEGPESSVHSGSQGCVFNVAMV